MRRPELRVVGTGLVDGEGGGEGGAFDQPEDPDAEDGEERADEHRVQVCSPVEGEGHCAEVG